jgi:hypothetical protein
MTDIKTEDGVDYFLEIADKSGVAVTSVRDGHVFSFSKGHLEGMLDAIKESGSDHVLVFVKNSDKEFAN